MSKYSEKKYSKTKKIIPDWARNEKISGMTLLELTVPFVQPW